MERAQIDGAVLAYDVTGTGEPVVFIHGALIADIFGPLIAELGLAGRYRLIRYHRRGYAGSSRVSGPIRIATQAADCRELLHSLGVQRAHVVGHSLGGVIALQLALQNAGMVHSLALLEPALAVGASGPGYRDSLAMAIARYQAAGAEAVVDAFLEARWPGYRVPLDRILPGAFDQAVADANAAFESEIPGLLEWTFGEAEARRIEQPTLLVLGGKSGTLSPRFGETHRVMLAWLLHAEGIVLPGATHFMQVAFPRGMAEVLAAFWARHRMPPQVA